MGQVTAAAGGEDEWTEHHSWLHRSKDQTGQGPIISYIYLEVLIKFPPDAVIPPCQGTGMTVIYLLTRFIYGDPAYQTELLIVKQVLFQIEASLIKWYNKYNFVCSVSLGHLVQIHLKYHQLMWGLTHHRDDHYCLQYDCSFCWLYW